MEVPMSAPPDKKKPAPSNTGAGEKRSNSLAAFDTFKTSSNLRDFQAKAVQSRCPGMSWPRAKVTAEIAFGDAS
jgi:hypothetical protein